MLHDSALNKFTIDIDIDIYIYIYIDLTHPRSHT